MWQNFVNRKDLCKIVQEDQAIADCTAGRANNVSIALYDVSLTSLTFGKELLAATDDKQVATREAERSNFVVEKAEQDKRSAIIRAQVVRREIWKVLMERENIFNIAPDDVSTAKVKAKEVAAQGAERAKFVVEKAEQDKRSAIIRAQGEAKSSQLIGQAIANSPVSISVSKLTPTFEAKTMGAQEAQWAKFSEAKAEKGKAIAIIGAQGEAKRAQWIGVPAAKNPAIESTKVAAMVAERSTFILENAEQDKPGAIIGAQCEAKPPSNLKRVAVLEAERAKIVLEKAEQDKPSAIIRAQDEAKRTQM